MNQKIKKESFENSRFLILKNILLPVNIMHGHLPGERMSSDSGTGRIDVLEIEVSIEYAAKHQPKNGTLSGVFSYGGLYSTLCEGPVRTICSPLETILDEILDVTEKLAVDQSIELYQVMVNAERRGLDVGRPVMSAQRVYHKMAIPNTHLPTRRSGFQNLPVQIIINHDWTNVKDRVEHLPHRHEGVLLNFAVTTESAPLDPDSLRGLFNYVVTHRVANEQQGEEISGPLELITDRVLQAMEEECKIQHLRPLVLECAVQRTGFTRCIPVIGLKRVYTGPA